MTTATNLPTPADDPLRAAASAADRAYTAAVQAAVGGSGDWAAVQMAGMVFKQCRAALKGEA